MGLFSKKPLHSHTWKLVALNDQYHTNYTDTGQKKQWHQRFYECSCGARKHTDNREKYQRHEGVDAARDNWIDAGVVPKGSYLPNEKSGYFKPSDEDRTALDPVLQYQKTLQDMVDSLGIVINRDFKLESKYPKLKEAADEYHRRLDKYRNFESLKETE